MIVTYGYRSLIAVFKALGILPDSVIHLLLHHVYGLYGRMMSHFKKIQKILTSKTSCKGVHSFVIPDVNNQAPN